MIEDQHRRLALLGVLQEGVAMLRITSQNRTVRWTESTKYSDQASISASCGTREPRRLCRHHVVSPAGRGPFPAGPRIQKEKARAVHRECMTRPP